MLMMMFPLLILYELGILLCRTGPHVQRSPFETQPA
jgi:Sec-independent protein secretion pathway component TatC